jgi:hypothetical protein
MVVGSEGTPSIWKYRLNPTPSIEPLTDPASIVLRDRMQLEINAYVQSAMSDLTSQHGGGRTPVIQPVELLHEREDNDRDVPATRPAS